MTRSDPPGAAKGNTVAAATYQAALEQFEELTNAAASVGYPARPLPLFYALSQAGAPSWQPEAELIIRSTV